MIFDIRKLVKPETIVFDIGAYHGEYSRAYREMGFTVHAFEGSAKNAQIFRDLNSADPGIILHEVALHEVTKTVRTQFNDCNGLEHPTIEVQYYAFDEYFAEKNLPDPSFVKMDIEGMETIALKAMVNLIENVRPFFQIELHNSEEFKNTGYEDYPGFVEVKDGGFDFNRFTLNGYGVQYFDEATGGFIPASDFDRGGQYIFIPVSV